MADHAEEQEMEAEALAAIFDSHFQVVQSSPPVQWVIDIYPEMSGDDEELCTLNHVACQLVVSLPTDYPETLPEISIELLKGLAEEHRDVLLTVAQEEAANNLGVPSIFAVAERLREWLAENNVKGLDDISMHAQMLRKKKEEEKAQQRAKAKEFESQKQEDQMTEAELEELTVRKRRAEGTPCTMENFLKWKVQFEKEMEEAKKQQQQEEKDDKNKKKSATGKDIVDKSNRLTGREYFSSKVTNLEALELAAEQAEKDAEEDDDEQLDDMNEDLFEEDVDVDDLDFDDDDDDEQEKEDVDI